jgi:hypothetical protein
VKDWGERVSEVMIKKTNFKKLYAVLFYLGVFTFCTCCIQICLVCIVAIFKLCVIVVSWPCVLCSCLVCIAVILCVFVVLCVHCCFLL